MNYENITEFKTTTKVSKSKVYRFYKKNEELWSETKLKNGKRLFPTDHARYFDSEIMFDENKILRQESQSMRNLIDSLADKESLLHTFWHMDWSFFFTVAYKNERNKNSCFKQMHGGWLTTKYDVFNRPVLTSWVAATVTSATRKTLQDSQNVATVLSETKIATTTNTTINGVAFRYTTVAWPTSGYHVLTVNYNDDYNFPNAPIIPSAVETQAVYYNGTVKPKGLSTGSWVRVPETSALFKSETSYTLYDYKARVIRSYTQNHLGGYTYTDSKLNTFTGQVAYTMTRHKRLQVDAELLTKEAFTYSDQERLMTHTHQIGTGGTPELLASNTYDELGQLIGKNVGNTVVVPLQKINYAYNIRGWLTEINKVAALQQVNDPKDLFGFKINYNTIEGEASATKALYNGNIAETFWSSGSDGVGIVRAYGYKYDNLNRLKDATFYKKGSLPYVSKSYDENLTYDKNGNIKTLLRNGDVDDALPANGIDNLAYTYATNSNKLLNVFDNSNNTSGFNDVGRTGDDYTYDANGNMITDKNKNITAITYNHLNLPAKITFGTTGNIVYLYNAVGQKVKKIFNLLLPTPTVVTTDYLGGYQYTGGVLQFYPTAEGYVKNTAGVYSYVFNYTDHLGNVRLSYTKNTDGSLAIIDENNYYPFGLKHKGYNDYTPTSNKYKYNGKELQDELGLNMYDYGARNYDPALGRWMNIDPLAEKSRRFSPYTYALNNPVYFIDPDGMQAMSPIYGTSGQFLGTDDEGLKGKAVVMDEKNFKQGMSHKEALANSLGEEGLKDNKAKSDFSNHYNGLKDRPDYDGKITLSEANDWYRNGHSEPLFADLSKIDLKFISSSQFEGVGDKQGIQTLTKSDDGLVYGNITLKYEGGNSVSSQFDTYNFERHNNRSTAPTAGQRIKDNAKRGFRNAATVAGRMLADRNPFNLHNSEFNIYFYGKGTISK